MHQNEEKCPIPSTHDKFEEAHYFLHRMMKRYHQSDEFRFNLNAFIQSLRNITFMLQSEENKPENFEEWYNKKREEMKSNKLLRKFVEGRNIIVKKEMLKVKSKASVGIFRGRQEKLGIIADVSPFSDSARILEIAKENMIGTFIDEEHSAIGEQLGVKRTWIVSDIADEEIVGLCYDAWEYMMQLVSEAHKLYGFKFGYETKCRHDLDSSRVLLETDIDPSLPKKWGWE